MTWWQQLVYAFAYAWATAWFDAQRDGQLAVEEKPNEADRLRASRFRDAVRGLHPKNADDSRPVNPAPGS